MFTYIKLPTKSNSINLLKLCKVYYMILMINNWSTALKKTKGTKKYAHLCQAFKMFKDGPCLEDVVIELDLDMDTFHYSIATISDL